MAAEPHLRAVPPPPSYEELEDAQRDLARRYAASQVELNAWRRRYYDLKEELDAEDAADPLWDLAHRLFVYQGRASGHERCEWTPKRFRMVKRRLKPTGGLERCLRAIAGNLADEWKVRHGRTLWEDVFGSPQKFEECLAKCPAAWVPPKGTEALL